MITTWELVAGGGHELHIVPLADLVEHDLTDRCPCGPYVELVPRPAGDGWIVAHWALDGRP